MSNLYSAFLKSTEQWRKNNQNHHMWSIKPLSTRYFESDEFDGIHYWIVTGIELHRFAAAAEKALSP